MKSCPGYGVAIAYFMSGTNADLTISIVRGGQVLVRP